jgi:hypothetical protein
MNCTIERRTPGHFTPAQEILSVPGRKSMHPDDYAAHLAWVTATRFHEMAGEGIGMEKSARRYTVG